MTGLGRPLGLVACRPPARPSTGAARPGGTTSPAPVPGAPPTAPATSGPPSSPAPVAPDETGGGPRLAVPPLAEATREPDGTTVFHLRAQAGSTELVTGRRTATWGYNGSYLGPTLRAHRGEKVRVEIANATTEDTTVHWHGMHLPAALDGGPEQPIKPGTTFSPAWTIDQPAATLWYHPHPHGSTADQVYRGAAGVFVVDDPQTEALALPHDYGVDDVPLVLQDKKLAADGSLVSVSKKPVNVGNVGDTIVVNGTVRGVFRATTRLVRFRVVNASSARPYTLGFADGRAYSVVATDAGMLPAPWTTDRVTVTPGERVELVVPVEPGDDVMLRSFPADLGLSAADTARAGAADTLDLLRLHAAPALAPSPPVPSALVPLDRLDPASVAVTRTFSFAAEAVNDKKYDPARIDVTAQVGTPERWEVTAPKGYHVLHVHDTRFLVESIDGAPPPPSLAGWKDTLWLGHDRKVRLLVRFEDYADPTTAYVFHCHVLSHEDAGSIGRLVVVDGKG